MQDPIDDLNETMKEIMEQGIEIEVKNTYINFEVLMQMLGFYYWRN